MAVLNDPSSTSNIARVGEVATGLLGGLHTIVKPLPATVGHYRASHRCILANAQVANSRLFELRNSHATNQIVLLSLMIKWLQIGAHTAAIQDSLDVFKVTGFTAVDTADVVTLTGSVKRTAGMTAFPGNAVLRGVTATGVANGMTGGTLVKDASPFAQLPQWLLAAQPTAGVVTPMILEMAGYDDFGHYPFVFTQNEGFIIENRVLLGAAAASAVYVDVSWAEVAAY